MAVETNLMRKFLNDPADVVKESLKGLAAAHPDLLRYDVANQIIVRKDAPRKGKVALISGGGSGHEPLHGGFVGLGMLDAAAPGEVFTSPVPGQMLAATKAVDGGAGVVHIVKNYTGDVLNFKLAAEDAADEGIKVTSVVIDDDVAVQDSLYTAGRRGVGATVLAEKLAGAAAEAGADLAHVTDTVKRVNAAPAHSGWRCPRAFHQRTERSSSTCPKGRSSSASASTASRAAGALRWAERARSST
jgi:dihydroxyacetone kinase-like protein